MNAKWHIINHLACAVVFLSVCSFSAFSQERDTIFIIEHDTVWMDLQPDAVIESQTRENRYDRRVHRYRRHWEALIPTHTKIQFAGLCKLNCVMLYSHSISSVGERPAPRGGTTRPDECKITTI